MRHSLVFILAASVCLTASLPRVHAAPGQLVGDVLYSSMSGASTGSFNAVGVTTAGVGMSGYGDDYSIPTAWVPHVSGIVVQSMRFVGGFDPSYQYTASDHLAVYLYDTTGRRRMINQGVYDSEDHGYGVHNLGGDSFGVFNATATGYVIFKPFTYSIVNPDGGGGGAGDPNTPYMQLSLGQAPTLGVNNPAITAWAPNAAGNGITPGVYGPSSVAQQVQFELLGYPEPLVDGDANLDGTISIDDYLAIDRGFAEYQTGTYAGTLGFFEGDFNHDGIIDFQDYAKIDASYAAQEGGQAASEISLHTSEFGAAYSAAFAADFAALPEPGSLAMLGCGLITCIMRKRRN